MMQPNMLITPMTGAGYPQGLLRLDYQSTLDNVQDWALFLPPAPQCNDFIVCLHGFGAKGNQLYMRKDLKSRWLPEFIKRGYGILTPTLRGDSWMSPKALHDMDMLVDYLKTEHNASRIILDSGSMGATSNLIYATLRPDNVSAVIARAPATNLELFHATCRTNQHAVPMLKAIADSIELAYDGSPQQQPNLYRLHSAIHNADAIMHIPVALAHGTRDALIPVAHSRQFIGALHDHTRLCYVEVPNGDHESPLTLGANENGFQLLDWLEAALKQH